MWKLEMLTVDPQAVEMIAALRKYERLIMSCFAVPIAYLEGAAMSSNEELTHKDIIIKQRPPYTITCHVYLYNGKDIVEGPVEHQHYPLPQPGEVLLIGEREIPYIVDCLTEDDEPIVIATIDRGEEEE